MKKEKAATYMFLDDVRRDAVGKIRGLSTEELERGWERISETVLEIMVSNELVRREGLLILELTQRKTVGDEIFRHIIGLAADGFAPEHLVEIMTNVYWIEEPSGIDAMVNYMQLRGMLLVCLGISCFELSHFLQSLIPRQLLVRKAVEISGLDAWEGHIWHRETLRRTQERLQKLRDQAEG